MAGLAEKLAEFILFAKLHADLKIFLLQTMYRIHTIYID